MLSRPIKFMRNVSFGLISKFWSIILIFFVMPFVINHLGKELYGVLAIIMTINSYFTISEFGVPGAIVKYISEYIAKKDDIKIKNIIQTSIIFYSLVGLICALFMYIMAPTIVTSIILVPENLQHVAIVSIKISAFTFIFSMYLSLFTSIIRGYQRFDLLLIKNILIFTFSEFLIVLFLFLGYSLLEIVLLKLVISILSVIIFYFLVNWLTDKIQLVPKWDINTFRFLFHFSKWKFIGRIGSKTAYSADIFLISAIIGIKELAFYLVPLKIAQYVGLKLMGSINQAIYPFMSESVVIDSQKNQKELYFRSLKWIFIILSPAVLYLIIFGGQFLHYWIGEEFSQNGTIILWILSVSYFLSTLVFNDVNLFEARGDAKTPNIVSMISAIIVIGLNIVLLPVLGILGAAVSFAISAIVTGIYLKHITLYKLFSSSWLDFLQRIVIRPTTALLVSSLLLYPFTLIGNGLLFYIAMVPVTGVITLIFFFVFRCFDKRDKIILKSFFINTVNSISNRPKTYFTA